MSIVFSKHEAGRNELSNLHGYCKPQDHRTSTFLTILDAQNPAIHFPLVEFDGELDADEEVTKVGDCSRLLLFASVGVSDNAAACSFAFMRKTSMLRFLGSEEHGEPLDAGEAVSETDGPRPAAELGVPAGAGFPVEDAVSG